MHLPRPQPWHSLLLSYHHLIRPTPTFWLSPTRGSLASEFRYKGPLCNGKPHGPDGEWFNNLGRLRSPSPRWILDPPPPPVPVAIQTISPNLLIPISTLPGFSYFVILDFFFQAFLSPSNTPFFLLSRVFSQGIMSVFALMSKLVLLPNLSCFALSVILIFQWNIPFIFLILIVIITIF